MYIASLLVVFLVTCVGEYESDLPTESPSSVLPSESVNKFTPLLRKKVFLCLLAYLIGLVVGQSWIDTAKAGPIETLAWILRVIEEKSHYCRALNRFNNIT